MELNMLSRQNQLSHLESYLNEVDTEVTMILQSLQWDRKHLLEQRILVPCQYNSEHRVPPDKLMEHEGGCFLKSQGYMEQDRLLPSPLDPDARTLVKLNADNIAEIINNASKSQALFKSGPGCSGNQPLTLERLQSTYTADERGAIHSAVVAQVPSCHDLSDLELLSSKDESKEAKPKSKVEILAELRDMKRRRTKYRVAAKTRNYSDVLRDVISTQMELYTQAQDNLMVRIKEEDININEKVREGFTRNDKYTVANQILKGTDDAHSKVSHHYDNRKRRHEDTYDAYNSSSCSKTQERDRATTRKTHEYKDMPYPSSNRKDYSTSLRRHDRHTKYSRANNEGRKGDDDYERRKTQRDQSGDHRKETHSKTDSIFATKDIKTGKRDLSKGMRKSSEENYLNTQRETQRHTQYEHSELKRENKDGKPNTISPDQQELLKSNVSKLSYHDNSYSSEDSEYMEKSEVRDKSNKRRHRHIAHYPKEEKEKDRRFKDSQNSKNGHDSYKQDNRFQVEDTIAVKNKQNIREDESDSSDNSKSTMSYHQGEKSLKNYDRRDQRNKRKYRDDDRYKNKTLEYEKDDSYTRHKCRESEKQHIGKHYTHVKEELDSSGDDQKERAYVKDKYHHSRQSSYKYNRDDKRYSKSHEKRSKNDEHINKKKYKDSRDKLKK